MSNIILVINSSPFLFIHCCSYFYFHLPQFLINGFQPLNNSRSCSSLPSIYFFINNSQLSVLAFSILAACCSHSLSFSTSVIYGSPYFSISSSFILFLQKPSTFFSPYILLRRKIQKLLGLLYLFN